MPHFLRDLPWHVRQLVYRYFIRGEVVRYVVDILLTNRQIHLESHRWLVEEATVDASDQLIHSFVKGAPYFSTTVLPEIRYLQLRFHGDALKRAGVILPHARSLRTLEINANDDTDLDFNFYTPHTADGFQLTTNDLDSIRRDRDRLCGKGVSLQGPDFYDEGLLAVFYYWLTANTQYDLILVSGVVLRKINDEKPFQAEVWIARTNYSTETMTLTRDSTEELEHVVQLPGIMARIRQLVAEKEY
ncbi:uncharacterized protein AB675_7299 [Cyphellophora attinorum]|uniref:Uncharacterized protein n=1 Tax=Cyphellophora attinorum TaxID=1664694 RepID=A0A0N1NX13_9EURO|nr:uncharacterized protein AB675_7299 [Phialophora attinorum]KPI36252.1 hypothetical protein AB675_7299 [Phialophora attinorum]